MVATPGIRSREGAAAPPSDDTPPSAKLGTRIAAYLIDTLALLIVLLVFFVIGGAVLLFTSDLGKEDAPDAAFNAFIAILVGGPIVFWSLLNLVLLRWRSQTAGMYVVGLKGVAEDGKPQTPGRLLLRWFGLHPVLYHPLFIPIWSLLAAYATSVTLSRSVLVLTLGLVFLCIVVPVASFAAMALDKDRRGLHDRLSRMRVVPVE